MSARSRPDFRVVAHDENVDVLRQAIMSQVRADAEEVIDDAKAQAKDMLQEAERKAEADRVEVLENARQRAEAVRAEAVGEAEIAAHQLQLKKREQLLDSVFQEARDRLATVVARPDYADILHRLTREALGHLGAEEAVVRFDTRTQETLDEEISDLLESLEQEPEAKLSLGEPLDEGTGVVVSTPDGHRRYDNSLQNRLRRMEPNLRAPVYHILVEGTS